MRSRTARQATSSRASTLPVACELAKQLGDGLVAILGHVLIPQCGRRGAMAESSHQLGQGCSGGGRQRRTGVAQVVEAKIELAEKAAAWRPNP